MTPEDVARLEQVGQIAISPDGSRVAYATQRLPDIAGEKNGPTKQQLHIAWGQEQGRDYLPADMDISHIRYTPDGRMISFIWAGKDEKDAVWGIPVDGGGHRKLAAVDKADVLAYDWAPDGNTLYLLASPAPNERRETEQGRVYRASLRRRMAHEPPFRRSCSGQRRRQEAARNSAQRAGHTHKGCLSMRTRAVVAVAPTPSVDDSYTRQRMAVLDLVTGNRPGDRNAGQNRRPRIVPRWPNPRTAGRGGRTRSCPHHALPRRSGHRHTARAERGCGGGCG